MTTAVLPSWIGLNRRYVISIYTNLFNFIGIVDKQQIGSTQQPAKTHDAAPALVQNVWNACDVGYLELANDRHQPERKNEQTKSSNCECQFQSDSSCWHKQLHEICANQLDDHIWHGKKDFYHKYRLSIIYFLSSKRKTEERKKNVEIFIIYNSSSYWHNELAFCTEKRVNSIGWAAYTHFDTVLGQLTSYNIYTCLYEYTNNNITIIIDVTFNLHSYNNRH